PFSGQNLYFLLPVTAFPTVIALLPIPRASVCRGIPHILHLRHTLQRKYLSSLCICLCPCRLPPHNNNCAVKRIYNRVCAIASLDRVSCYLHAYHAPNLRMIAMGSVMYFHPHSLHV